ncbi:hypothetical protein Golomagni_04386 [Golovinomyces magnicellulatus]|nr:hypothetical protein Golomagni_04386 [Golovinomyces magnicellulatus]
MIDLKRKRSGSGTQVSASSFSSQYSQLDSCSPTQTVTHSLCPSRTRKRHRNSRPSDSEVFDHTLSILFSAQRNSQTLSQDFSSKANSEPPSTLLPSPHQPKNQSFLSSYWNISSRRETPCSSKDSIFSAGDLLIPKQPAKLLLPMTTACEDCGKALYDNKSIPIYFDGEEHRCRHCGKYVCDSCSISYIGTEMKCLNCVS